MRQKCIQKYTVKKTNIILKKGSKIGDQTILVKLLSGLGRKCPQEYFAHFH